MARITRLAIAGALTTLALATPSLSSQSEMSQEVFSEEEAEGIIFERQNIMMQMNDDAELLGEIVAGIKPVDDLERVTASLAQSAQASKEVFELHVPGGRSRDEVWTNREDYSRRMTEFAENTAQLAKLGEAGDVSAVASYLGKALPCKQCHDVYRKPKD